MSMVIASAKQRLTSNKCPQARVIRNTFSQTMMHGCEKSKIL